MSDVLREGAISIAVMNAVALLAGCEALVDARFDEATLDRPTGATSGGGGGAGGAGGTGGAGGAGSVGGMGGTGGTGGAGGGADPTCSGSDGGTDGVPGPSCASLDDICGPPGHKESCCAARLVPGGSFFRGQDPVNVLGPDDAYTGSDTEGEGPEHSATVDAPHLLDTYEVAVGRFRRFFNAYPYVPQAESGQNPVVPGSGWKPTWAAGLPPDQGALDAALKCHASSTWSTVEGSQQAESMPVNCVSWFLAFAFCVWDGGRLPTEAEWEYAAVHGSNDWYYAFSPTATAFPVTCAHANSKATCGATAPMPVGSASCGATASGQFDMAGNLWEWCFDAKDPYLTSCTGASCAVVPQADPALFTSVLRGGGWDSTLVDTLRAARRGSGPPAFSSSATGFRCARTP